MVLRAREANEAAAKLGIAVHSVGVHDLLDFDAAFAAIEARHADALLTLVDPFTLQHRKRMWSSQRGVVCQPFMKRASLCNLAAS
jgi:hypothetical protein